MIDRINSFIQAHRSILLEYRDDAVLQIHVQKLLNHCKILKSSLAPKSCVGRFVQELPLLKEINPANRTMDKIGDFLKTPPQLPLEIWENILFRLKPIDLIRMSRTTKVIKSLCTRKLVQEVNQKSLNDMGIDSRYIFKFLRSLGAGRAQIVHLDLRESLPFSSYNDQIKAIISLAPNVSFLAINSSELDDSHLQAIARLSKLKRLDLYISSRFTPKALDQLRNRTDLELNLHTVQMKREIAIIESIRWQEMEAAFQRRLDARLSRKF